jgi:hypothetical protein
MSPSVLRSENKLRTLSSHGILGKLWERRATPGREGQSKERAVTKQGRSSLPAA